LTTLLELLKARRFVVAVTDGSSVLGVLSPSSDIKTIYDWVEKIEHALKNSGFDLGYVTEEEALEKAREGEVTVSLITPTITKEEVRKVALRGEVFAHKATRHIVPARPMNVKVPLGWIDGSIALDEARRRLTEYLGKRQIKTLPPGTVLDRRYDEELFVFE